MSKTKRKRYSGAFKAKVGLEALIGVKTVGQIARDYEVHPVQVTQWKGVIRDHLPELFESPQAVASLDRCAHVARVVQLFLYGAAPRPDPSANGRHQP